MLSLEVDTCSIAEWRSLSHGSRDCWFLGIESYNASQFGFIYRDARRDHHRPTKTSESEMYSRVATLLLLVVMAQVAAGRTLRNSNNHYYKAIAATLQSSLDLVGDTDKFSCIQSMVDDMEMGEPTVLTCFCSGHVHNPGTIIEQNEE